MKSGEIANTLTSEKIQKSRTELATGSQHTWVKICGLTNLEDAVHAAEAGADFLGFVFHTASSRAVLEDDVIPILRTLRRRKDCPILVGVFVDETAEKVAETLDRCQLDLAQLHGSEPPWMVGDSGSPLFGRSYKALKPTSLALAQAEIEWYLPSDVERRPSLLIDAYHPTLAGGTGQRADWDIAAQVAAEVPGLMLAGGLNSDNVEDAVHRVRPFAVDVSSGVEVHPGRKDHALVEKFIRLAKGQ